MPDNVAIPNISRGLGKIPGADGEGKTDDATAVPATLGSTARAGLLLRTWCNGCGRIVDIAPAQQVAGCGADLPFPEWAARLVCSQCGSRAVDFVVSPRHTGG